MQNVHPKFNLTRRPEGKLTEVEKINHGRLFKLLRMNLGLGQSEFANYLDIKQGTVSKIERGQLEISTGLYIDLTKEFQITDLEWDLGVIDKKQAVRLRHYISEEASTIYGVPHRYSFHCGSSVRTNAPLIKAFKRIYGPDKFRDFLKAKGFKADGESYFYNYANTINANFSLDLFHAILRKTHDRNLCLQNLAIAAMAKSSHGVLASGYSKKESAISLIKTLVKNTKLYDVNTKYQLEGNADTGKWILKISPRDHLDRFKIYDPNYGDILGNYKHYYFHQFLKLNQTHSEVDIQLIQGLENHSKFWEYHIQEKPKAQYEPIFH